MNLSRILLRPLAAAAGYVAGRHLRAFLAAHQRTAQTQHRLLADLLAAHAETAFGRDHNFAALRSYDDFTAAVPVRSYEELRPYMVRVWTGETTALLPAGEEVLMFSRTSGTTGAPKHIPVTRRVLAGLRRGWNIFGLRELRDHPKAWLRCILPISSPMDELRSPAGVPCGAVSGLLAATQLRIVRRMYVVPPTVAGMKDPVAKTYTTLRCGVGRDVALITTANPSSTIQLIEAGQVHAERLIRDVADGTVRPPGEAEPHVLAGLRFRPDSALARRMEEGLRRDGHFLPRHVWNVSVLNNWTGGTLGLYLPRLRALFDGAPVRDIGLLASEGRFSVPLADETPAGVAEITGNVLEFMPVEEYGQAAPAALPAHAAELGREYVLIVTNASGLFRYNLEDRVRVVDRFGASPVFEFLSRGPATSSITGEKITEHQVVEAMRRAAAAAGLAVERFVLQGRFAAPPHYELRVELGDAAAQADALAARLDEALAALNVEYRSKRHSGRLGAIRPVLQPPGTFDRAERDALRRRAGRAEQYKHQYLRPDVRAD